MEIRYYTKHVYGKPMRYPADAMSSDLFKVFRPAQHTITNQDIEMSKLLGLEFKEVIIPEEEK